LYCRKSPVSLPKSFRRPGDFAARWGGEEFVALLPNTPLDGAIEIAEKIRSDIEQTVFKTADGIETRVTLSVGVNSLIPTNETSIDAFFSKADRALYSAKEAGKNKVIHI